MIDQALYSLEQLNSLSNQPSYYQQEKHLNIRLRAIKDEALSLGAQAGLATESNLINKFLINYNSKLDSIFDFSQLLLNNNVLPPVISSTNNSLSVGRNSQLIRVAGRSYKIISQVKFVTAPPTWRNYLYMNYLKPSLPNKVLLPSGEEAKKLWQKNIVKGWQKGMNQAVTIYKINLNRLVRDYTGMVLYEKTLN
ncbi:type IV secretory system conjugative DNA transfer family protein [Piscirickettsia litoralis]|uniref:type IV secretory system conjugative DNA transfer family protein n=1 Tax=Piscirickettsia litoralis TaxID=1891921 RepID=UPI000A66C697|nr:type IV secretory system conjugative DNA transfer family protein [Piscirickettsia litoralis]